MSTYTIEIDVQNSTAFTAVAVEIVARIEINGDYENLIKKEEINTMMPRQIEKLTFTFDKDVKTKLLKALSNKFNSHSGKSNNDEGSVHILIEITYQNILGGQFVVSYNYDISDSSSEYLNDLFEKCYKLHYMIKKLYKEHTFPSPYDENIATEIDKNIRSNNQSISIFDFSKIDGIFNIETRVEE